VSKSVMCIRASAVAAVAVLALIAWAAPAFAQAPAAAPPPPPPGWTGSVGGGLALTSGNSDTSTTNVGYDVLKDHGTNVIFKSAGLLLKGSNNGVSNVDRSQADARVGYTLSPRLSAFGQTTFARDNFKAIDYILAPTGGLSYKVVNTARTEWLTDGSVGVVFEKNKDLDVDTSGAIIAGEKLTHKFAEKTKFVHAATALWKMKDFDDAFYTLSAGLLTSIAGNFDLKTEFLSTYKNKLTNPALKKADQSIVLSVVYKY
jgi:putative salt-induced outer membrane protein YdiY